MLLTEQFYALYPKNLETRLDEPELILYLFADGETFLEITQKKKTGWPIGDFAGFINPGVRLIQSSLDYKKWANQAFLNVNYFEFIYKRIDFPSGFMPFLTSGNQIYREFAKRYLEIDPQRLRLELYKDLPIYQLFMMDFDYDGGKLAGGLYWGNMPHDYELIKRGRVEFYDSSSDESSGIP